MITDRRLIMILLLAAVILLAPACGVRVTVSSDTSSISEEIQAGDEDAVKSGTVISAGGLSHSIEGRGNLNEIHSVSNTAGARAEVGANIRNAEWYSYSYDLWPGKGSSWSASRFAQVAASEQLDVLNARYIQAYAKALNAKGYTADVNTVIYDPGKEASLSGYRNLAMASKNEAMASQTADGAWAPNGYIQEDAGADFTQLKSHPLQFREDEAKQSARVDHGSVEGYSDLASASAYGITSEQQMEAATGEQIQTKSQAASWTASLFQGLKKTADAGVKTTVEGTLIGYNASAESSKDQAEAEQTGHVTGVFSSTAVAGKASETRTSNYGNEYDFEMQARKDATGSFATGRLGYYVDNNSPVSNKIQGAVDASQSGDTINVAGGTYNENVDIQKSLDILGAGASETIVDGGQAGSVFTIGSLNNADLEVALSGMTIQGGTGTPVEIWPGHSLRMGGGILNYGTMKLNDCTISGNTADYGGGIYNAGIVNIDNVSPSKGSSISYNTAYAGAGIFNDYYGTVNLNGGSIDHNTAPSGAGIYNVGTLNIDSVSPSEGTSISYNTADVGAGISNQGILNLRGGSIDHNSAYYGGGIYNGGILNLDDVSTSNGPSISYNTANYGGGIYNFGTANLNGGSIDHNHATWNGGGIYNRGTVNLNGGSIDHNDAYYGGGIYNDYYGTLNLNGGSIDHNNAVYGSGIYNIYIDNVSPSNGPSISYNTASNGGGIYNDYYGTANLKSGSIDHNTAYNRGGGIYKDLGTITGNTGLVHDNIPDQIEPQIKMWRDQSFLHLPFIGI